MTNTAVVLREPQELAIPDVPPVPTLNALATLPPVDMSARKDVSYKRFLDPAELTAARQEAEQVIVKLIGDAKTEANPMAIVTYASDSVSELNRLVDDLLEQNSIVEIPELEDRMKSLRDRMRELKSGYDLSVPDVRDKYERMAGKKGWLRTKLFGAKTMFEMFFEDIRPFQDEVDKVSKELTSKQTVLLEYVGAYQRLLVENDRAIRNMIFKVVVMELMVEMAKEQLAALPSVDSSSPHSLRDQHGHLQQFITSMERKITEYKTREILAETTAPDILGQRGVMINIATNLGELVSLMLPVMKLTQFTWSGLLTAKMASDQRDAVAGMINETLVMKAEASGQLMPELAANAAKSTIAASTIYSQIESIELQAQGFIDALQVARQDQAEKDVAIAVTRERLSLTAEKLTEAVLADALKDRGTLGMTPRPS